VGIFSLGGKNGVTVGCFYEGICLPMTTNFFAGIFAGISKKYLFYCYRNQ
jgi:hypothetical protein